jgi:sterol desaturase/sphingolipid hydroxylase (fatty acid hydroxylase superfamily)
VPDLGVLSLAAVAGWLSWQGWSALTAIGSLHAIQHSQVQLAGPVVLGFVLIVFLVERVRPAEPRPVGAKGHRTDVLYLFGHVLVGIPLIVLIGTGCSVLLQRHAPWLVLPHTSVLPRAAFIAASLIAIDAADWLAHFGNHKVSTLWRLHAVHHSQEELSILSTFRTHPLVHLSFAVSVLPVLALSANAATPAELLTIYACLGALPHANVRWSYGRVGRYVVSPAYHRLHHSPTGRLDLNLGTLLTVWDRLARRAVFPARTAVVPPTGLAGRPVPVEQAGDGLLATFAKQWIDPFGAIRRTSVVVKTSVALEGR